MRFGFAVGAAALLSYASPALGNGPIFVGYYPTWRHGDISNMDLSNYTHINVAFAIPEKNGSLSFEGDAFMDKVVTKLQGAGSKVLVSVGGWAGSAHFSTIVKDAALSEAFTTSILHMMKKYKLDGIDIDWEFPGLQGSACNAVDKENDATNFLKFLTSLRAKIDAAFGKGKLITLALRVQPFEGPGGKDVSGFAKVVDFANIMQYDLNGAWGETTGPLAPLNFETGKGTQLSFATGADDWIKAGWPAKQLTGGAAFYGFSVTAQKDMVAATPKNQYQPFAKERCKGDQEDEMLREPCSNATKAWTGIWAYKNIRTQGLLSSPTTASSPWVRTFDNKTMTPWLFNPENKTFISYEDPVSLAAKARFAKSKGLGGMMVWSVERDFNGELWSALTEFK
ncbi:chitinase [Metarhizium album ARSEF 1941]|uniref:chitinase n=1 Tax=Metarhizium album (strain ARSEF 1941) TaxID=1081103 RepID=A0A0B2X4R4_METAS|nr:chitinase [Metarhizium album ARSEF 1941]KHO01344.1 chitinase [Metarhizium album ARSEF 1941]